MRGRRGVGRVSRNFDIYEEGIHLWELEFEFERIACMILHCIACMAWHHYGVLEMEIGYDVGECIYFFSFGCWWYIV